MSFFAPLKCGARRAFNYCIFLARGDGKVLGKEKGKWTPSDAN